MGLLSKAKDFNVRYHHQLESGRRWFEFGGLLLTGILLIPEIASLISNWLFKQVAFVDDLIMPKTAIEIILFLYFFSITVIRYLVQKRLDKMTEFYSTLNQIRDSGYAEKRKLVTELSSQVDRGPEEKKSEQIIGLQGDFNDITVDQNVASKHITTINRLAKDAWGEEEQLQSANRLELYRRWFQANPKIFSIIRQGDEAVGYMSILPMSDKKHLEQKIDKVHIDNNFISPYPYSTDCIFIENIYLRKDLQNNKKVVWLVFEELLNKIDLFTSKKNSITLYAQPYYRSFKSWLKRNGFVDSKSKHPDLQIIQLTFQTNMEEDDEYEEYVDSTTNDEKAEGLVSSFNVIAKTNFENRFGEDFAYDHIPFIQNINEFFGKSFHKINKEPVVNNFLGKTFKFYTHAIYKDERNYTIDHSLGHSYIHFNNECKSNFIPCKFYTGTKAKTEVKNRAYVYNGVCLFSKNCSDILMIFHPKKTFTDKVWVKHGIPDAPLIITGKIMDAGNSNLRYIDPDEGMLLLNITTFSQHYAATVSKLGLLHMKPQKPSMPDLQQLFTNIELDKDDDEVLRIIKLYLMRSNKVIIKGRGRPAINNKSNLTDWMEETYWPLKNSLDKTYELYYFKDGKSLEVGAAYLNFLSNGVAKLSRFYSRNEEDVNPSEEQYFGEINIRYNENHHKFLYIKFIQMNHVDQKRGKTGLRQDYRELFLILFWPENGSKFEYTRGVIMGDRDVQTPDESVISSNICVLCDPNEKWVNNINLGVDTTTFEGLELLYNSTRLENVRKLFLSGVLSDALNTTSQHLKTEDIDFETMIQLLSFNEIEFSHGMCNYNFKNN